jgi:hypothetical protein
MLFPWIRNFNKDNETMLHNAIHTVSLKSTVAHLGLTLQGIKRHVGTLKVNLINVRHT